MKNTKAFDFNKNISFLAKKLSTKEKYRVLNLDLRDRTLAAQRHGVTEILHFNDVRLLAYTRLKDIAGRKIYEHSFVEVTRMSGDVYCGIVMFKKGWGIKDYIKNTFIRFSPSDKLRKIHKK